MKFVQTIRVKSDDVSALEDFSSEWHESQAGVAPGYLGIRILADRDRPGEYLIVVDFASAEEAAKNNEREETQQGAPKLAEIITGDPEFANYDEVYQTG